MSVLVVTDLHVAYGKVSVLRGLNLVVGDREIVALLGPNGSGKSTTVRAIAGLVRSTGSMTFADVELGSRTVRQRVQMGITLVQQGKNVFDSMTVEENLIMGAFTRRDADINDDVEHWLHFFPEMRNKRRRLGARLSGGERQMVALGSGLMSRPSIVLLDEPSLGVAPKVLVEFTDAIRRIRDEMGLSVVLVEQDVPFALGLADRVVVLAGGRIALEDTPDNLQDGERLHRVYFGS